MEYGKTLILGQSGQGKTFLSKTADRETTGFINVSRKPLSFRGDFKFHGKPKSWAGFLKNFKDYIENDNIEAIIVDDVTMAFDMLLQEAQRNFKGYDIYGHFNKQIPEFLDMLRDAKKHIIVTGHDEILLIEGYKQKRAKIHGKQYEGVVERYFTTVLYADSRVVNEKPQYFLRTFEVDTSAKAPEGMFDTLEIPNDAKFLIQKTEEYYGQPESVV